MAADPLHGLLILLGESRIPAHQVEAGDDHLIHDGDAFVHAGFVAAAEQLCGALVQRLRHRQQRRFLPYYLLPWFSFMLRSLVKAAPKRYSSEAGLMCCMTHRETFPPEECDDCLINSKLLSFLQ